MENGGFKKDRSLLYLTANDRQVVQRTGGNSKDNIGMINS
jgi:hypothetical protein